MGCGGGSFFSSLLITAAVALITDNVLISSTAPLSSGGFPGPRTTSSSSVSLDPVIRMLRVATGTTTTSGGGCSTPPSRPPTSSTTRGSAGSCPTGSRRPGRRPGPTWAGSPGSCTPASPISSWTRSPPSSPTRCQLAWTRDTLSLTGLGLLFSGFKKQTSWKSKNLLCIDLIYILMAEPDQLIFKPIPNLSKEGLAAAFPFFYIEPKKYESTLRKFFPVNKGLITDIDPMGNSPVIVEKASLMKIASTWMNVSLAVKKDPEADKAFGWVLEMYVYAVASALHGVGNILHKAFMIQPLWDLEVGEKFIIHYTYGCDYDLKGQSTYGKIGEWRFDKRSYDRKPPPRNLALPPPGVPQSVVTLVKMVNKATANILDWEAYGDGSNSN